MASYTVTHEKAACFYDRYERKAELQHQTHYCPGCGHGIVHKLLAEAIDELGIQDRTVLISPVGCSVFAYYYFDVGNIQVAHGRAPGGGHRPSSAAGPRASWSSYQGDGDLAAIGTAEIVHAANRGEPITVIFVNNAIYGMTGGQMAPTTPLGKKTTTSPFGRNAVDRRLSHARVRAAGLAGSAGLSSSAWRWATTSRSCRRRKAIRKARGEPGEGLGFSFVEVLSPCPTIWKMDPVEAQTLRARGDGQDISAWAISATAPRRRRRAAPAGAPAAGRSARASWAWPMRRRRRAPGRWPLRAPRSARSRSPASAARAC